MKNMIKSRKLLTELNLLILNEQVLLAFLVCGNFLIPKHTSSATLSTFVVPSGYRMIAILVRTNLTVILIMHLIFIHKFD